MKRIFSPDVLVSAQSVYDESPIKTRFALDVDGNSTYLLCKSIQPCLLCRGRLCIEAMFKMMGIVAGTEGPSSSL